MAFGVRTYTYPKLGTVTLIALAIKVTVPDRKVTVPDLQALEQLPDFLSQLQLPHLLARSASSGSCFPSHSWNTAQPAHSAAMASNATR
jgi:hypothetical protein